MPHYVILQHETAGGVHFDFMLEMGGTLKTWTLPQPPISGVELAAEALPDHRLAYLDYEGLISGDRGSVTRWDRGTYELEHQSESELALMLAGEKLIGHVTLRHPTDTENRWRFYFL